MTTPTPAQIEAAAKALHKEYAWDISKNASESDPPVRSDYATGSIRAALEAVVKWADELGYYADAGAELAPVFQQAKAALTAAADVKPNYKTWEQADREDRNATIEDCAQVADEYPKVLMALPGSSLDSACRGIAAAIRAKKERP